MLGRLKAELRRGAGCGGRNRVSKAAEDPDGLGHSRGPRALRGAEAADAENGDLHVGVQNEK